MPFDAALDGVAAGASIVMVELPPQITGEADGDLAQELVASIFRLLHRRAWMSDDGRVRDVTAADIGVVCAHVSQVNAVRERLGPRLSDVFVETANRFQGIERPFMYSCITRCRDAPTPRPSTPDAGRLCVMHIPATGSAAGSSAGQGITRATDPVRPGRGPGPRDRRGSGVPGLARAPHLAGRTIAGQSPLPGRERACGPLPLPLDCTSHIFGS